MQKLTISIFQTNPKYADAAFNLNRIEELMQQYNVKSTLIVLPEMFNTSYMMEPGEVAETEEGFTITTLKKLALNYDVTFMGSIPMKSNNQYFNSSIIVDKDGLQFTYDKMHLYSLAGEHEKYSAGQESKIHTLESEIKIKPLICYDLRFPYLSFNNGKEKYDLLIYSANWPAPRIHHWKSLLTARAIENQCYVIGVNRVGKDANEWEYPGKSMVVNCKGEILLELDDHEQVKTMELSFEEMMEYRGKYPFLNDVINTQ